MPTDPFSPQYSFVGILKIFSPQVRAGWDRENARETHHRPRQGPSAARHRYPVQCYRMPTRRDQCQRHSRRQNQSKYSTQNHEYYLYAQNTFKKASVLKDGETENESLVEDGAVREAKITLPKLREWSPTCLVLLCCDTHGDRESDDYLDRFFLSILAGILARLTLVC